MKSSILILLIFLGQISTAQWRQDTTISKKMLDSLNHELFRYKNAAKESFLNQVVKTNTIKVDSVYSKNKDTLTIINYSKFNSPLRKKEIIFDNPKCKRFLIDTYYDTTGKMVYEEQWKLGCNSEDDVIGFLKNRTRYHYDNYGSEIGLTTEFWNGGGHRVRRFNYTKDIEGKKIWGERYILNEYAFWD